MAYNSMKLKGLFQRVYDNKMVTDVEKDMNDEKDIREYCSKVFGDGSRTPDPSLLHQFNNLIVEQSDVIARPTLRSILGLFCDYQTGNKGDVLKIQYPASQMKTRVTWSATGSGVDLVRIAPSVTSEIAQPKGFSTGVYYEPLDMAQDAVENFRKAVNDIAEAKIRLYYQVLKSLMASAIASGKIPSKNVKVGTDLTLADYNKIATTLSRYGGRPVFVADMLMIDYFARQQVTDPFMSKIISQEFMNEKLTELVPTKIGKTVAVDLYNPFIDRNNNKVDLDINIGYMYTAGQTKPFVICEFGGMRQLTEQDIEDERIKLKIMQDADIRLVAGYLFGYIKEDGTGISL